MADLRDAAETLARSGWIRCENISAVSQAGWLDSSQAEIA
jgi:hypothetical protein